MVGMVYIALSLNAENDIVCIEIACWLKKCIPMPFDPLAQKEGVFLAISGNLPVHGQARDDICLAANMRDEGVVQRNVNTD
jgi:hypothetical protein